MGGIATLRLRAEALGVRTASLPAWVAPAALTLLAAALRFSALGDQSMWYDEARTANIVEHSGLGRVLGVVSSESTPPLYYLVVWVWAKLAGGGDYSLRTVAALAGTATVPVTYLVGLRLSGRRAALIAAAMVATSPYLIYYSQENRPYSALALAGAGTLLLFLRARDTHSAGALAWWGVGAVAALAVHYFAAFFLLPQAVLLLSGAANRRRLVAFLAPAACLGLALGILAVTQLELGTTAWIGRQPLDARVSAVFHHFTKGGFDVPGGGLAVLLLLLSAVLLARADSDERRSAALPLGLAAATMALPLLLVPLGIDLVLDRNLIGAWPLLALVGAIGFASTKAGRVGVTAAAALCVVWAAASVNLQTSTAHRREDWRGAAAFIATGPRPRVVIVDPGWAGPALRRYKPRQLETAQRGTRVSELAVVASPAPPAGWPRVLRGLPGFRRATTWEGGHIAAATYHAEGPRRLPRLPRQGVYFEPAVQSGSF